MDYYSKKCKKEQSGLFVIIPTWEHTWDSLYYWMLQNLNCESFPDEHGGRDLKNNFHEKLVIAGATVYHIKCGFQPLIEIPGWPDNGFTAALSIHALNPTEFLEKAWAFMTEELGINPTGTKVELKQAIRCPKLPMSSYTLHQGTKTWVKGMELAMDVLDFIIKMVLAIEYQSMVGRYQKTKEDDIYIKKFKDFLTKFWDLRIHGEGAFCTHPDEFVKYNEDTDEYMDEYIFPKGPDWDAWVNRLGEWQDIAKY